MRFKRVTKLLACILAASMCTVPVFASGTTWQDGATDGKETQVRVDFGVNSPTLKVKVPTQCDLKVNPLYNSSATNKVESFTLASKEFVISNNTSDNSTGTSQGVKIMCTATASVTPKQGVMVSYNTVSPQRGDTRKLAHLDLTGATDAQVSESQNAYAGTKGKESITPLSARLQVEVAAPTIAASGAITAAGYGAFAITGQANTGADWQGDDLTVQLSYRLRAVGNSDTPINSPVVPAVTAASSNNTSTGSGTPITTKAQLPISNGIEAANVTGILIHSPENAFQDYFLEASKLTIDKDSTGCAITVPKEDVGLQFLAESYAGKTQDLLIGLDDGRIIATTITVN